MEDARFVHATLGHQEMEVHVQIDPVPKGLDGGDDPGRKHAPGHNFEVTAQGPEGRAAVRALLRYFQAATGAELIPGVVAVIQSFGQKINFHPHAHLLVTEGEEDSEGKFHHVASFQDSLLAEFFKREVIALLLRQELISEALVEKIAGWRHSGFSAHSKVKAKTRKEAERVGKYMIRPLLSLERLSLDEKEGKVC